MAWYDKVLRGAAAFTSGVAQQLPQTLQMRQQQERTQAMEGRYAGRVDPLVQQVGQSAMAAAQTWASDPVQALQAFDRVAADHMQDPHIMALRAQLEASKPPSPAPTNLGTAGALETGMGGTAPVAEAQAQGLRAQTMGVEAQYGGTTEQIGNELVSRRPMGMPAEVAEDVLQAQQVTDTLGARAQSLRGQVATQKVQTEARDSLSHMRTAILNNEVITQDQMGRITALNRTAGYDPERIAFEQSSMEQHNRRVVRDKLLEMGGRAANPQAMQQVEDMIRNTKNPDPWMVIGFNILKMNLTDPKEAAAQELYRNGKYLEAAQLFVEAGQSDMATAAMVMANSSPEQTPWQKYFFSAAKTYDENILSYNENGEKIPYTKFVELIRSRWKEVMGADPPLDTPPNAVVEDIRRRFMMNPIGVTPEFIEQVMDSGDLSEFDRVKVRTLLRMDKDLSAIYMQAAPAPQASQRFPMAPRAAAALTPSN